MSWDDILFEETSLEKLASKDGDETTISFKVPKKLKKELDTKIRKKVGAIGPATAAITRNRLVGAIAKEVNRKVHEHSIQKTAGLFMKPSDIADHQNLANALEGMLNGAGQGTEFKQAGVNHKMLVGAGIGTLAGASAHFAAKKMKEPQVLKVDDVQGFGNKMVNYKNKAMASHSQFAKNNPKTSLAVHTASGALAGGLYGSNAYDRYKRVNRKK